MAGRDVDKLHEEIEELFADLWQVPRFSGLRRGFRPNADSYHTDEPHELTVVVELPGVDPDDVQAVIADGTLTVAGNRSRPKCKGLVYQQMELEYGPFQRRISLPDGVDVAAARATYDRGILRIVLPIVERSAPGARVAIEVMRS